MGVNDHAGFNRRSAGGGRIGPALDLDDAQTAAAVGRQTGIIAQGGNVDPALAGSLQNREAAFDLHALVIDMDQEAVVWVHATTSLKADLFIRAAMGTPTIALRAHTFTQARHWMHRPASKI